MKVHVGALAVFERSVPFDESLEVPVGITNPGRRVVAAAEHAPCSVLICR